MLVAGLAPEVPTLVLHPGARAPRVARRFLAGVFQGLGIADDYVGRLVVCELVTNAWLHGEGLIVVRIFLDARDGQAVIEVSDAGEARPVVRVVEHTATSGRGLALMGALVEEWGVRPLDEGGKAVWARLREGAVSRTG